MPLPCPRCRFALPAEARFCPQCGAESAVLGTGGFAAGPEGTAVCVGCGVIAPSERTECEVCDADFEPQRPYVPPRADGMYWVAVRCKFQCRSCGHLSPLNHLDMDGSVSCLRCGLEQSFDVSTWDEGLGHAHAVGDLAGDQSLAGNHYARIGWSKSSAQLTQGGLTIEEGLVTQRSLRVEASPGHPLCDHCRRPLQVTITGTRTEASCASCADSAVYELPPQAATSCPALKGILAEEQRADRREATLEQNEGAIGLRCPNCSAALTVTGASSIVTCEFCRGSALIPGRTLFRLGHRVPEPLMWWLLFDGPSAKRWEFENQRGEPTVIARLREPEEKPKPAAAVARPGDDSRAPTAPARRGKRRGKLDKPLSIGIPLLVLAGVGLVGFRDELRAMYGGASQTAAAAAQVVTAAVDQVEKAVETEVAPATRDASFAAIDGCDCRARVDGKRRAVQLEARVIDLSSEDAAMFDLGWRVAGMEVPLELEVRHRSAPPKVAESRDLALGVACFRDQLAVVSEHTVELWSLRDGRSLWSATLPRRYRGGDGAAGDGLTIHCDDLRVKRGKLRVPAGKRGRVEVDLERGVIED